MRLAQLRPVADVLARLARVGLRCVGANLRTDGSIELAVEHPDGPGGADDAVRRAWGGGLASVMLERTADGPRYAIEVGAGLYLTWQASVGGEPPAPPAPPVDGTRLRAFQVRADDQHGDVETVLASSPTEAAAFFAAGWGVADGTVLSVVEEPIGGAPEPQADTLLFIVGQGGSVQACAAVGGFGS